MQAAEGAAYPPSSPFILDSAMGGSANDPDLDFEFFDANLPLEAPTSPGIFLPDDLTSDSPQYTSVFDSPKIRKHPLISTTSFLDSAGNNHPVLSAPVLTSPAASSQDSSSVSSRSKRKASGSDSSQSVLTPGDTMMADDTDMGDWKVDDMMTGGDVPNYSGFMGSGLSTFNGTIDPSKMSKHTFDFSDKSMENDFDFESAASSPSPFATGQSSQMDSLEMSAVRFDTPAKNSPKLKTEFRHQKANSQNSTNGLTSTGSREASPLSAMVASQESSPSAFFNSPSPSGGGVEFIHGSMLSAVSPHKAQQHQFNSHNGVPPRNFQAANLPTSLRIQNNGGQSLVGVSHPNPVCKPRLTIHPTPLKSRVETQLPIKMTLFPMPPGVTKLHLPKHTISKPKLLSKPPPEKTPEMLELSTMLVCSSAMQNPEKRQRAFARAVKGPPYQDTNSRSPESQTSDGTPDEEDESKPLNGGEVHICGGCITRERKRAARKKAKKAEDEEAWHKDEHKRVIVFNTHEIKDWQAPSSQTQSETTGDRAEPIVPEGAMQVDAPMRIACYCRHQNEKLGFQVIFTIKDHLGRLVAQEISSSIMITDDHKTHNMPPNQDPNGADGLGFPNQGLYPIDPAYNMAVGSVSGLAPFRMSHSSSDLQALQQQQYPVQYQQQVMNPNSSNPSQASQSTSGSLTPRNLSRQGSPSGSIGPSSKKRKASGSVNKVPTSLAMTRLENVQPAQINASGLPSAAASSATSPYTPAFGSFQPSPEHHQFNLSMPSVSQQFTGPPTPNSNDASLFSNANRSHSVDNLAAIHQLYSAPASSHPSRAPSPNGLRQYQHQAQIAQAVANGLYGMPLSLNPHRPPTIHKLIPFEGPKAGGIEVTCLGSGFCQGLEVMFGENKATTTTFWGETSLVCLLPPAAFAGPVTVTFKHQRQQLQQFPASAIPKQQVLFKYIDDDEQQIIRTALSVLHHKMTGKMEDVRDLARRIVGDGPSSWNSEGQNGSGSQSQHGTNFATAPFDLDLNDVEGSLLRVLDLIDLDDSPNVPRLNYRRPSGQTMLHLACSLGLHRFVAALIARGANPEPRDKGGFTPMHFAALHNHPHIVRRLMLGGADPTMRSLLGYTPADLATSEEVLRATRRIEHHSRTRSNGSIRSRTSSVTSLRSLWEPLSTTQSNATQATTDAEDDDTDSDDNDEDPYSTDNGDAHPIIEIGSWRRSSRSNATRAASGPTTSDNSARLGVPEVQPPPGFVSPTAAMTAFREQMSAHFQHIQQTMHLNLPNLPNLPPMQMPTLPDYQAYLPTNPMVKRISSMVPHMGASRPSSADGKEQDYKWWDLFSGSASTAPPAYDDIFPDNDVAMKRSSAAQAAADAVADNKCATLFDLFDQTQSKAESPSPTAVAGSSTTLETVHIGSKHPVSKEMQAKLRLAHAEKVKRIKSDRNLFFIWIPLLVIIILAMSYNRVPQVTAFLRTRYESHVVGVH